MKKKKRHTIVVVESAISRCLSPPYNKELSASKWAAITGYDRFVHLILGVIASIRNHFSLSELNVFFRANGRFYIVACGFVCSRTCSVENESKHKWKSEEEKKKKRAKQIQIARGTLDFIVFRFDFSLSVCWFLHFILLFSKGYSHTGRTWNHRAWNVSEWKEHRVKEKSLLTFLFLLPALFCWMLRIILLFHFIRFLISLW